MLFSSTDILQALHYGHIGIDPFDPTMVNPASVDLRLSAENLLVWESYVDDRSPRIVPWEDQAERFRPMPLRDDDTWTLRPGQFALASTAERVTMDHTIAGRLEGKSSLARLGLIVHTTAGFFDPGFEGWPTLELVNVSPWPFALAPGMPIAQMAYFNTVSAAAVGYEVEGRYRDQSAAPQVSRYHEGRAFPFV